MVWTVRHRQSKESVNRYANPTATAPHLYSTHNRITFRSIADFHSQRRLRRTMAGSTRHVPSIQLLNLPAPDQSLKLHFRWTHLRSTPRSRPHRVHTHAPT